MTPTKDEVFKVIYNLKMNNTSGPDEILNEMSRYGENDLKNRIYELIKEVW